MAAISTIGKTSLIELIPTVHNEQRKLERGIGTRDWQTAIKYGRKTLTRQHWRSNKRTRTDRYMYEYNGIIYITEADSVTAVTCYAKKQLPLKYADIHNSLHRQIQEQKRRLKSGAAQATSHIVLIVDQSGSMNKGDMMGHRTRSRGAFYTIANEIIAAPLYKNQMSYTDLVTLIELRDDAYVCPDICMEPMTWELHNKIVQLAETPRRGSGHGNYLPSLLAARDILNACDNGKIALFLLFLSDGRPSDNYWQYLTTPGLFEVEKLCRDDAILKIVSSICMKFKKRLTFGTFGFADDVDGNMFHLMEAMANQAKIFGCKSVFKSGLDSNDIRKALYTLASSLLSTRSMLSSLSGGANLKKENKRERTDLIKDNEQVSENLMVLLDSLGCKKTFNLQAYNVHSVEQHGAIRYIPIKSNRKGKKGFDVSIDWEEECEMAQPDANGIAIKKRYSKEGAERIVYEATEVHVDHNGIRPVGPPLVAKLSRFEEKSKFNFQTRCAETQFNANRLAQKFNTVLDYLEKNGFYTIPKILFLNVSVYTGFTNTGTEYYLCEQCLGGKGLGSNNGYKKWNDNKGGVWDQNSKPRQTNQGFGGAMEGIVEEEEDEMENGDMRCLENVGFNGSTVEDTFTRLRQNILTVCQSTFCKEAILDDDVPQAFSHWTYAHTKGDFLVCDLQGVKGTKDFQFTDPAIHSKKKKYGATDHGKKGQRRFFKTHKCNPLCLALNLEMPILSSKR
eukprot:g797.t1